MSLILQENKPFSVFHLQLSRHVFLEKSDILYYMPRPATTVYIGKDKNGSKVYKSKHYLLFGNKRSSLFI